MCECGHEFWDHESLNDPNRSGGGGPCRKAICECMEFVDGEREERNV